MFEIPAKIEVLTGAVAYGDVEDYQLFAKATHDLFYRADTALLPIKMEYENVLNVPDATASVKGIAKFKSTDFTVSSGEVTIRSEGVRASHLSDLLISGTTAIAELAFGDELLIGDVSGNLLRKTTLGGIKTHILTDLISGLDSLISTSSADSIMVYDSSHTANKRFTMGSLINFLEANAFSEGEGINIVDGEISGEDATDTNKGIASFNDSAFSLSSGAVSLKTGGIYAAHINENAISGQTTALTSALASDDELLISDVSTGGGYVKRMDISVLQTYMQDNLDLAAVSFGSQYQIPITNSGSDDYDYLSTLKYQSGILYATAIRSSFLAITETGSVSTPTSAGIFWASTDGNPMYTNDAGIDYRLSAMANEYIDAGTATTTAQDHDVRQKKNIVYSGISGSGNLTLNYLREGDKGLILIHHSNSSTYDLYLYGNTDGSGDDFNAKTASGSARISLTFGSGYVDIIQWWYVGGTLFVDALNGH